MVVRLKSPTKCIIHSPNKTFTRSDCLWGKKIEHHEHNDCISCNITISLRKTVQTDYFATDIYPFASEIPIIISNLSISIPRTIIIRI